GWLGICMPEEYGGSGLGIQEAAVLAHTLANTGGGMSAASAVHMNIFGLNPVVVFGNEEQKRRMLPPIASGTEKACCAVTERTTDLEEVKKPTQGLSLFYTALDRSRVRVSEIEKMGRKAIDSNELFIDGLEIPVEDRIGEEGRGFEYILHGMNPERVLIAAEAVGLGQAALRRAADYARERVVCNRPIGKNQAIAHPLAQNWIELEAAWLMTMKAAWEYDQGLPCGASANAAKWLAGEA